MIIGHYRRGSSLVTGAGVCSRYRARCAGAFAGCPPINYMLAFLWLAVITNAVNFLDNMDGLAAELALLRLLTLFCSASFNDQYVIAPMAAAMLGACLGFCATISIRHAFLWVTPARSCLVFLLAVMTLQLRFPANSNFVTWMVPVLFWVCCVV